MLEMLNYVWGILLLKEFLKSVYAVMWSSTKQIHISNIRHDSYLISCIYTGILVCVVLYI